MPKASETPETKDLGLMKLSDLPNLHNAEVSQKELSSEYWTPEKEGEYKVGVILSITEEEYTNPDKEETILLPCVTMIAQNEDLSFATIRNGSVRLVATIQKALDNGDIEFGTVPVKVMYTGKKKNKNNQFMSDRWSVKPLVF